MSPRRLIITVAAVAATLGLGAAFLTPPKSPASRPAAFVVTQPPRPLPAPLAAQLHQPGLVSFWATWCVPCLAEMPSLGRFKAAAEARGIGLITVLEERAAAKSAALRIMAEKGLAEVPLIVDDQSLLGSAVGIIGIPTTLVVNDRGEEIARLTGGADWSRPEILSQVEALIAKAPRP